VLFALPRIAVALDGDTLIPAPGFPARAVDTTGAGDIFRAGRHLLSLINDILDLSKIEAGKMTLDLEPVEVSSLFANSLSIVKGQAAARHIHLDMDAPDTLGSIHADARKVKQIVYNLLSNAVKFSADGGLVSVRATVVRFDGTPPSPSQTKFAATRGWEAGPRHSNGGRGRRCSPR